MNAKKTSRKGHNRAATIVAGVFVAACSIAIVPAVMAHASTPTTPAVTAPTVTNTYPLAAATIDSQDGYGFEARECTSFVAYELRTAGTTLHNENREHGDHFLAWGNASHWDATAHELGFKTGTVPVVGAVAQWHVGEASTYAGVTTKAGDVGHVAYVIGVTKDGAAIIAQYNAGGAHGFSTAIVRAPRYLYIGVAAPAAL